MRNSWGTLTARLACAALLAVAAGGAAAQAWEEHRPAGAGYRAQLPGKPQIAVHEVASPLGPLQNNMAIVDLRSQAMVVTYADISAERLKGAPPEEILSSVRNGLLGELRGARLDEEVRLTMNGFPARQLLITDANARRGLRVRIALAGRRLYQAIYVGAAGQEKGEDARRFIDSFALTAER